MFDLDCVIFDGSLFTNRYPFVEFFFQFETCMLMLFPLIFWLEKEAKVKCCDVADRYGDKHLLEIRKNEELEVCNSILPFPNSTENLN